MRTRLNKRLVELGLAASRRGADRLILSGDVSVNGQVIQSLGWQVETNDVVAARGKLARFRNDITIAFNKPPGYICSHVQQGKSPTMFELLPMSFRNLKIAGRLDRESVGLMILSTDGDLVQRLTHPSNRVKKTYLVRLDRKLGKADIQKLLSGVKLGNGSIAKADKVSLVSGLTYKFSLHEGKNRHIRRSLDALGYEVKQLARTQYGRLQLGKLTTGKHKIIQPEEIL